MGREEPFHAAERGVSVGDAVFLPASADRWRQNVAGSEERGFGEQHAAPYRAQRHPLAGAFEADPDADDQRVERPGPSLPRGPQGSGAGERAGPLGSEEPEPLHAGDQHGGDRGDLAVLQRGRRGHPQGLRGQRCLDGFVPEPDGGASGGAGKNRRERPSVLLTGQRPEAAASVHHRGRGAQRADRSFLRHLGEIPPLRDHGTDGDAGYREGAKQRPAFRFRCGAEAGGDDQTAHPAGNGAGRSEVPRRGHQQARRAGANGKGRGAKGGTLHSASGFDPIREALEAQGDAGRGLGEGGADKEPQHSGGRDHHRDRRRARAGTGGEGISEGDLRREVSGEVHHHAAGPG